MESRSAAASLTPRQVRLLLDGMFSPVIAEELIARGHQVRAVAADPELRAMTDAALCAWAEEGGYTLVTENVKDFRPLAAASQASGRGITSPLLFTSSRSFPRSRRNVGVLILALHAWLARGSHPPEEWLGRL